MSNFYKKYNKDDFITHKATIDLNHGGGAWDYKSNSKAVFYDHTSKRQFKATEFGNWLNSPHIKDMINRGANLKIATQDFEDEQAKYGDGLKRKVIFYFSALKNPPPKPVDGFKPIGQAMPQYTQQPMTQAQPSAPDHAMPVQKIEEMDDEIPF
tara:strand:+ start:162 stop:623 length:462 start_codon:yes stop_codon:yes gene_type:complete